MIYEIFEPVTLWIFPVYGLLVMSAFFIAVIFSYVEWRKNGFSRWHWTMIVMLGSFFAVYGGRWWYLAFNPSDMHHWWSFITIRGGRSILGTIATSFFAIWIYTRTIGYDLDFRYVFSIIAPNILLAQSIGRWGNFYNQEVYGMAVESLSWLPNFIQQGMFIDGSYRVPLFLYESVLNMVGWIFITFILKNMKSIKPGVHGATYLTWYGITRASMELFRDPQFVMKIGWFPTSFFLSFFFILTGLIMIYVYQFKYTKLMLWMNFYSKPQIAMMKSKVLIFFKRSMFIINSSIAREQKIHTDRVYNNVINTISEIDIAEFKKGIKYEYNTWS